MEDEPASKKLKTEDSLMPEEEFLCRNKGPVSIKVQVPNMQDKTEWKLKGRVLVFTLPLTDQVSVIKVKIHEATGMPAGRQAAVRGHCHQGFQLAGLLQHGRRCRHSPGAQGEGREEEVEEKSLLSGPGHCRFASPAPTPCPRARRP